MKLTALEIKQQTFERSFRGYDVAEVNAFLSIVSNEWENLVTRNKELERELNQMKEKVEHYQRVEEALHETLQTAKESAEQRVDGARKEARTKIEKAEMEAESMLREARQQRQQVRQSILRLLDRRDEIIRGIRSYLELAQESLDQFSKDESGTFTLPKGEAKEHPTELEQRLQEEPLLESANQSQSEETHQRSHRQSLAPGAEDMDDIIDEIE